LFHSVVQLILAFYFFQIFDAALSQQQASSFRMLLFVRFVVAALRAVMTKTIVIMGDDDFMVGDCKLSFFFLSLDVFLAW